MFIISASISSIEFRLGEISITRPLLTVRGEGRRGGGLIVQFHSIELMNAATQYCLKNVHPKVRNHGEGPY